MSLPTHAAQAPWLAALPLVLLAGSLAPLARQRARLVAIVTRLSALVLAAVALAEVASRPAHARLLATTLLTLARAGSVRLEWSLAATPANATAALLLIALSLGAALRHPRGGRGLGWTGLATLAATGALFAGDFVTLVASLWLTGLSLLGLLRTTERANDVPRAGVRAFGTATIGAVGWWAGALLLFWSAGHWNAALANRPRDPVPVGVEEAMRAGDRAAAGAVAVPVGPTFSIPVLRDLVTVESTGVADGLDRQRVFGGPLFAFVALFFALGALVASGALVAGWWRALETIAPADRFLAALAVAAPPLVMLARTSFLLEHSPGVMRAMVAIAALTALVASSADLPLQWRSIRIATALALAEVALVALQTSAIAHIVAFVAALFVLFVVPRARGVKLPSGAVRSAVVTVVAIVAGIVRACGNLASWIDRALVDALLSRLVSAGSKTLPIPSAARARPELVASLVALSSIAVVVIAPAFSAPLVVTLAVVAASSLARAGGARRRVVVAMLVSLAGAMAVLVGARLAIVGAGLFVAHAGEAAGLPKAARRRGLLLGAISIAAFVVGALSSKPATAAIALTIAFLARAPLWPLSALSGAAHDESPPPVAMLSPATWLVVAAAGLHRVVQWHPDGWRHVAPTLATWAVASLVWQALVLVAARDLRKIATGVASAFASFVALTACAASLASLEAMLEVAVAGALSTALVAGAFDALARRAGHRAIDSFGGLVALAPELAVISALGLAASGAVPFSLSFAGEALSFTGSAAAFLSPTFVALVAQALVAGALAWTLDRVYLGPLHEKYRQIEPLSRADRASLWPLAVLLVVLAAMPTALVHASANDLVAASTAILGR